MLHTMSELATIVGSLAFIGVFIQIYLLYQQIKSSHEKARRENAVNLLIQWSKGLKQEASLARKVVETFNEEQCRALFKQESLTISANSYRSIKSVFKDIDVNGRTETNGEIELNQAEVSKLRWLVMSYLNLLESILVAWQYSIIDRDIIEHQFSYIVSPEDGHHALKYFRIAAGGEACYPAIEIFCIHLEENRRKILIEKSKVF